MDIGPFVHHFDPIIGTVFGVHVWWYGLSYSLGFLGAHLALRRDRHLGLSRLDAYELTLWLGFGVLAGGRAVEVGFYEWPFYHQHPKLIPALWLGGMATHGLLLGGLAGIWVFCRLRCHSMARVADALAIPAALILGLGRLGNFVDGQIVGSLSTLPWAVKFPDAEGFRHPVVLYDGLKNLALIPLLGVLRKRDLAPGRLTGWFLFLYAFLRLFVDRFREYPTTLWGLGTGQTLNGAMALLGLALLAWPLTTGKGLAAPRPIPEAPSLLHRLALGVLLLVPLVIPSDWTQDVPARYGRRHQGLVHSRLYPAITPAAPGPPVSSGRPPGSSPGSTP